MITLVTFAAWLIDYALLATVVLAVAFALRACFRDPAQRVALAWGTWIGLLLLAFAIALPQWPRLAVRSLSLRSAEIPAEPRPATRIDVPLEIVAELSAMELSPAVLAAGSEPSGSPRNRGEMLLVGCWLAAGFVAASWIALGLWQTWRLVRRSQAAPRWVSDELTKLVGRRREPQVRISRQLTSAAAVGALVPRILLPMEAADQGQRPIVRAALAHEWAHIRHGDLWLVVLERWLVPLLAWQPLFWWLRRSVRLDLELLADAAAAGDDPVEYAEALVAWARSVGRPPAGLAALSLWESPHTLSRRVTMLLDSRRPLPPHGSRRWQFVLAAVTLLVIGGLSLLTLRPPTAGGQEAQRDPAPSGSPDEKPVAILLKCLVLEADRAELAAVLPVKDRPQPDPQTDTTLKTPDEWKQSLAVLKVRPGTTILSRPQIITLDGQTAHVEIGGNSPPLSRGEGAAHAADTGGPANARLKIQLTPKLTLQDSQQQVVLALDAARIDLPLGPGGAPAAVEHQLATKAVVPLGQTVIVASRPQQVELKPLLVAVEVQLAQQEVTEQEQNRAARAEDLQRTVRQLQRELERRTAEAQAQREQSEALRKQIVDLKMQLDKLAAAAPVETQTIIRLKNASAADVADALKLLLDEVKLLGGDAQVASIKWSVDEASNSLIVSAQSRHWDAIKTIVARLDQPGRANPLSRAAPPGEATTAHRDPPPIPALPPSTQQSHAANLALAERETQVQLRKLDLQEAEIHLQAARKDYDRVQELRKANSISEAELSKFEFEVRAAEIKVMRAKIMLDGAMRQMSQPPQHDPRPVPAPRPAR